LIDRRPPLELTDVGSGDERLVSGACNHHGTHVRIASQSIHYSKERAPHLTVQRIAFVGTIHSHERDTPALLDQNDFGLRHRSFSQE
jgi:hypothetical protein